MRRQIVTSQRAHTKYKWPPYATEWTPPWKFSADATDWNNAGFYLKSCVWKLFPKFLQTELLESKCSMHLLELMLINAGLPTTVDMSSSCRANRCKTKKLWSCFLRMGNFNRLKCCLFAHIKNIIMGSLGLWPYFFSARWTCLTKIHIPWIRVFFSRV